MAGLRMIQDIAGGTLAGEIYADLGSIYLGPQGVRPGR
jgi:hypothetical protein